MSDRTGKPIWQSGRVILKHRTEPDGSLTMFKPFMITDKHIMRLTGAPGWDKASIDAFYTDGVKGRLWYQQDIVEYSISIEEFREHAFVKDMPGYGEQYHVHRQFYHSQGMRKVSPIRENAPVITDQPKLPTKLTFGEWVPCESCHGQGGRCPRCQGNGFVKWSSAPS